LGADGVYQLIQIKRADIQAHNEKLAEDPLTIFDEMETLLHQILDRGDCCTLKQLEVTGKDIMALGYKGRAVGDVLEHLLKLVLVDPSRNDKAYLMEQAVHYEQISKEAMA
ncbi:MAG: polynucleotide adenylyltransferase, partial [Peptococcaceae bacterium]|nr:polynucleotide adenylyltransferase [Peptococcaceae bacterium]